MSTDYDVRCLDCEVDHGFYDANHEQTLMRGIAKLGPELAAAAPLMRALKAIPGYVEPRLVLQHDRYPIDFEWFAKHGSHRLISVDEYGRCDDECGEFFRCGECQTSRTCRRPLKHDGEHADKRDDAAPPQPSVVE